MTYSDLISEELVQTRRLVGELHRKLDEILYEIGRLAGDRCPEPDEYPEELYGVAEKIRSYVDRL